MKKKEEWRNVGGFEGRYEVSSLGRVRSKWRARVLKSGKVKYIGNKIIAQRPDGRGYLRVNLNRSNLGLEPLVAKSHQVVAKAFIGERKGLHVNHKDGVKTNNKATNLEYTTHIDNIRHSILIGVFPIGEKSHMAKLKKRQVLKIISKANNGIKINYNQWGRRFKVDGATIRDIYIGKTWKSIPRGR